jgi:hypothetical protein
MDTTLPFDETSTTTILVLDISGSMEGSNMQNAKQMLCKTKIDIIIVFGKNCSAKTFTPEDSMKYLKSYIQYESTTLGENIPTAIENTLASVKTKRITFIFTSDGELYDEKEFQTACKLMDLTKYNVNFVSLMLTTNAAVTSFAGLACHNNTGEPLCLAIENADNIDKQQELLSTHLSMQKKWFNWRTDVNDNLFHYNTEESVMYRNMLLKYMFIIRYCEAGKQIVREFGSMLLTLHPYPDRNTMLQKLHDLTLLNGPEKRIDAFKETDGFRNAVATLSGIGEPFAHFKWNPSINTKDGYKIRLNFSPRPSCIPNLCVQNTTYNTDTGTYEVRVVVPENTPDIFCTVEGESVDGSTFLLRYNTLGTSTNADTTNIFDVPNGFFSISSGSGGNFRVVPSTGNIMETLKNDQFFNYFEITIGQRAAPFENSIATPPVNSMLASSGVFRNCSISAASSFGFGNSIPSGFGNSTGNTSSLFRGFMTTPSNASSSEFGSSMTTPSSKFGNSTGNTSSGHHQVDDTIKWPTPSFGFGNSIRNTSSGFGNSMGNTSSGFFGNSIMGNTPSASPSFFALASPSAFGSCTFSDKHVMVQSGKPTQNFNMSTEKVTMKDDVTFKFTIFLTNAIEEITSKDQLELFEINIREQKYYMSNICAVCRDDQPLTFYYDACMHLAVCDSCAKGLTDNRLHKKCIVCRQDGNLTKLS